MQTIIRIEYKDGNGLWNAKDDFGLNIDDKLSFINDLIDKHSEFPTPMFDTLINRKQLGNEYCAFKSIEQLNEWINKEWFNEIISVGFKILMIDVSECIIGEYQILYKKENILQTKDISNLFIHK